MPQHFLDQSNRPRTVRAWRAVRPAELQRSVPADERLLARALRSSRKGQGQSGYDVIRHLELLRANKKRRPERRR
jgi:hypothetical protein